MPALKHISLLKGSQNFVLVVLIGMLFLTSSAFVSPQAQTPDPFAKQLPKDGMRSKSLEAVTTVLPLTFTNRVQDPSFESSYTSNAYWEQYSTNFGTPLCILADCGDGAGTARPRTGAVWSWFGGVSFSFPGAVSPEIGYVYQWVPFPSCGTTLQFYFWIGKANAGSDVNDYFAVKIDGHQIFSANATQKNTYSTYRQVSLDVSPYANGATRKLEFYSRISGQLVTFNLDDISLTSHCYTVSGNAGVAGATLRYTGGSTIANINGEYSFNVAPSWSGTVTPAKANYIFSPASRTYTSVTADKPGQDYTAIPLYSISGTSGVAGVTLSYTNGAPRTAISQPNGNYSLTVPEGWSGPVTPSHACFTFNPTNRSYNSLVMNVPTEDYTPSFNSGSGCADITAQIGGVNRGRFGLLPGASTRTSFAGVSNGPVKIMSTNAVPLIAAERLIYKVNNVNTSFIEMMGLPDGELDNVYWLPWYNNVDLDTQLRFANVSGSTATVHVYIGASEMTGSPFTLDPGASTRKSFPGVSAGPVKIESDQNIVAAERVIYKVNNTNTSFSEMMGLPEQQLDTIYWLPWYNNVDLDTQLRFANVSGSSATVHVYIGGAEMTGSPFTLEPGASTRKSFPGISAGPMKIESDQNIVAAERLIYEVNNVDTSFSEMMALPNNQVNTTFWLPWYNNVDLDTQLRFANVSGSSATVHVYIGGSEMTGSPFTLAVGESTRKSFAGINAGPVQIVSDQNIVAAERLIYKVNNVNTSFSEMMGLPDPLLNSTFWLPWYNNVDLDTQLRFAAP